MAFLRRNGVVIAVAVVGIAALVWVVRTVAGSKTVANKPQEFSMVRIALPPPPTPLPQIQKKEEPPKVYDKQQMIEQEPVANNEQKPAEQPKPEEEAAPMGTNIQGNGPDAFGLVGRGNGGIIGGRGTGNGSGGGGGRWGWYAGQVQSAIQSALSRNSKTRTATLDISVRIWPDSTGRVERAQLITSTGDREIDDALQNEVLKGLTLREPPPADMPSPIVLRLTGRRP